MVHGAGNALFVQPLEFLCRTAFLCKALRDILTEAKRPMQSWEIAEQFRNRGRPISETNELKMSWNALWKASKRGTVTNVPRLGYWLSGEPLPPGAREAAKEAQLRRKSLSRGTSKLKRDEWKGRPRGRPRDPALILSPEDQERAMVMLIGNQKTVSQICQDLGISLMVLKRYFPSGRAALRKQYPELAAQNPPPPPRKNSGGGPRGPRRSSAILEEAKQMYQRGKSVDEIVPVLSVPRSTIYRYLISLGIIRNRKPGPKPRRLISS